MNRKHEIEKYLMPLLPEEPEEITATALQREYTNGYLEGQKKAYDECDEIARELSQIKSGCSEWLDKHDTKIRADAFDELLNNVSESVIWDILAEIMKRNIGASEGADRIIDYLQKVAENLKGRIN